MPPRTLAYLQIGGTGGPESNRLVGCPELQPGGPGWGAYVDRWAMPLKGLGFDAAMIGNPGGLNPEEPMDGDQFIEARDAGLRTLTNGFAAAWRRVTSTGFEVIGYNGTFNHDQSFRGLRTSTWLNRAHDSLNPYLAAGMNLAFDAVADIIIGDANTDDDKTSRLIQYIDAVNEHAPVYVEAWWHKDATWCHGMPCIVVEAFYQTIKRQGFEANGWARPRAANMPEVIRCVTAPPAGETWANVFQWWPRVRDGIMADGHSVAIGAYDFVIAGVRA
jgi:hypothetical protein